ncbi:MAG: hypothetical protein HMLKMBBP_00782 [Planctomycetes bacterium]|nr:hypothetical protein [Planctomycetota bacterium]
MNDEMVIAAYRPKAGQDAAVLALIARHVPTLRAEGLATQRPVLLMRASDGTYLEIFEWKGGTASSDAAHHNPRVLAIWGPMHEACEFVSLGALPEAGHPFPHFKAVDGVVA